MSPNPLSTILHRTWWVLLLRGLVDAGDLNVSNGQRWTTDKFGCQVNQKFIGKILAN